MSNYSTKPVQKPLKGVNINASSINVGSLTANSVNLENVSIAGVYSDGVFQNVVITNSSINNTPIGIGGESVGYFTSLNTTQDVTFAGTGLNEYVAWDALTNTFSIGGTFELSGCAFLGNIEICVNTISATNLDGNINIIPNNTGIVNIIGSVMNQSTVGNYIAIYESGNYNISAYDLVSIGSSYSSVNISSYSEENLKTINGDVNIITELGKYSKFISSILLITSGNFQSSGSLIGIYQITTNGDHDLRINNEIEVFGTGIIDGNYIISNIINNNNFTFTSSNLSLTQGSSGEFLKYSNNNINLSAGQYINIPSNINLNFGYTSSNLVGDSLGNLNISSLSNINTFPLNFINIPANKELLFGDSVGNSGNIEYNSSSSTLVISSNIIQNNGSLTFINSTNTKLYDPILTLADYTTIDSKDRGIEFFYPNNTSSNLGWYGYKNNLNGFAFILNATNNNEIISGQYADIYTNNVFLQGNVNFSGGNNSINMNCGKLINVNTISGCGNILNLVGNSTINITSNNINLLANSNINIPESTFMNIGNLSYIQENSIGNLIINNSSNIYINSNNNIIVPKKTYVSFDGTTNGSNIIWNDLNMNIKSNTGNINLSSSNIIIPEFSILEFGNLTNIIYSNTNGLNINTNLNNIISSLQSSTIISSSGNIQLYAGKKS